MQGRFLPTLFSFEIEITIHRFPLLLQQSNVRLFLLYYLLYCLSLNISVLSRAQSVHVLKPFIHCSRLQVRGLKLVNHQSYTLIYISWFQIGKLLGCRTRRFYSQGDSDQFVLVGSKAKRFRGKGELFGIVEAEEEVGDGRSSVVDDLKSLGVVSA